MKRYSDIFFRQGKILKLDFLNDDNFNSFETATDEIINSFYRDLKTLMVKNNDLEANISANYVKTNNADMVLFGKETIDFNGSQVGGMVAALLDMPYVSLASKLDMNGTNATIEREIEGGVEVIETSTPFVLSAAKGMAEARIPNMRGIMAARTKPLNVVAATDAANATEIKSYLLPPEKTGCKYVDADNVEQLIDLLHNEAKAI